MFQSSTYRNPRLARWPSCRALLARAVAAAGNGAENNGIDPNTGDPISGGGSSLEANWRQVGTPGDDYALPARFRAERRIPLASKAWGEMTPSRAAMATT